MLFCTEVLTGLLCRISVASNRALLTSGRGRDTSENLLHLRNQESWLRTTVYYLLKLTYFWSNTCSKWLKKVEGLLRKNVYRKCCKVGDDNASCCKICTHFRICTLILSPQWSRVFLAGIDYHFYPMTSCKVHHKELFCTALKMAVVRFWAATIDLSAQHLSSCLCHKVASMAQARRVWACASLRCLVVSFLVHEWRV